MNKNKIKIFFPILLLISVFFILINYGKDSINEDKEKNQKDEKFCNINIEDEDNIKVEEIYKIDFENVTESYTAEILFDAKKEDFVFKINNFLDNIKVFVDGKEISYYYDVHYNNKYKYDYTYNKKENGKEKITYFNYYSSSITIYNLEYGKHVINIEYEIKPSIIQQYSNLSVLRLVKNDNFLDYKIKINCFKDIQLVEPDTKKAIVDKISSNEYLIDMFNTYKMVDKGYIELKLDRDIVNTSNQTNQKYSIINKIVMGENFTFKYLGVLILVTVVLFISVKFLTRRKIIYKNYIKNTEILLDPIYAESLIDGKIGTKELIMSCIMDLVYRKKIEILDDNETLKIKDLDDIDEMEKKIIALVFNGSRVLSFKELEIKFNLNVAGSIKFSKDLEKIKKEINESFFDKGIYSKVGECILKNIKTLALIIIFNFVPFTLSMHESISKYCIWNVIYVASFLGILFTNVKVKIKFKPSNYYNDSDADFFGALFGNIIAGIIAGIIGTILYTIIIIEVFESNILLAISAIVIVIVNIKIFRMSKIHCLTNKGTMEYNKIYGLKKYIKDYSLMEQREIESIKIWDRYLVYACAFGISTRITEKIDESALKLNSFFEKIDIFSE